jgi:hypothetical protein
MRIDTYTKSLLTIIAIGLLYLCMIQTERPAVVHADANQYNVPVVQDTYGRAVVPVEIFQAVPAAKGGSWEFKPKP